MFSNKIGYDSSAFCIIKTRKHELQTGKCNKIVNVFISNEISCN